MTSAIVNRPAIDWLTFTTWERESWEWFNIMATRFSGGDGEASRMEGYQGIMYPKMFIGYKEGEQHKPHYMLRSWGVPSDDVFMASVVADSPMVCKRIDLQITIPLPDGYNAKLLAERIREEEDKRYNGRKVHLYDSGKGMETVYVGSWHSDKFYRIYVKQVAAELYLRFEVVFKHDLATKAYELIKSGKATPGGILNAEVGTIKVKNNRGMTAVRKALKGYSANMVKRVVKDKEDTRLYWLRKQVMPALFRMVADEEIGDHAASMLQELHDYARELGRLE